MRRSRRGVAGGEPGAEAGPIDLRNITYCTTNINSGSRTTCNHLEGVAAVGEV